MRLRFDLLPSHQKTAGTTGTTGTISNDGAYSVPNLKTILGTTGTHEPKKPDLSPMSPKQNTKWGHLKPAPDKAVPNVPNVPSKNKEGQIKNKTNTGFYNEELFERYWAGFVKDESAMARMSHLFKVARTVSTTEAKAWAFAEGVSMLEYSGDDRRACLECRHYKPTIGSDQGNCLASGIKPLTHMRRGAVVNWYWLNRCPMNTKRQRKNNV